MVVQKDRSCVSSYVPLGLAVWANTKWTAVGMYTAIIFTIGVGLPGSSIQSAGMRTLFSLIGMLWALLGVEIHRFALSHRRIQLSRLESAATTSEQPSTALLAALRSALPIGIVSALGYTVGLVLGLPRHFWIVVPIILAIRSTSSPLTMTFTSMMIIGTVAGALIATVITLETNNHHLLLVLLFSFAVVVFATLGVSITLTQMVLVPFVIILLNLYYPGQWYLPLSYSQCGYWSSNCGSCGLSTQCFERFKTYFQKIEIFVTRFLMYR